MRPWTAVGTGLALVAGTVIAIQVGSTTARAEVLAGLPVLSIDVEPDHLFSPERGILMNIRDRGRDWERPAAMRYFQGGEMLQSSDVGVRLHGGSTRLEGDLNNSYRLYFRNSYGETQFTPEGIPNAETVTRLVVRRDRQFITALGFDIARRLGATVPPMSFAMLIINGKAQGVFSLTPHLSAKQWKEQAGHSDFLLYRYKGSSDKASAKGHQSLVNWVGDAETPWSESQASERIDLDNLSRHLFAHMFCANREWPQGVAVLNSRDAHARWSWVFWDVDHGLARPAAVLEARAAQGGEAVGPASERRVVDLITDRSDDVRTRIFVRLVRHSAEYRQSFLRVCTDALNHRITPDYLVTRLHHYRREAKRMTVERPDRLGNRQEEFMKNRGDHVRREIGEYLQAGAPIEVKVLGPTGIAYWIDGFPESSGYRGQYFSQQRLQIDLVDAGERALSHWLVNGEKHMGPRVELAVEVATVVEPVFVE